MCEIVEEAEGLCRRIEQQFTKSSERWLEKHPVLPDTGTYGYP